MAFRFSYRLAGPADYTFRKFKVAASQDIKYGNLLVLSSGKAAKATPGATNILGVALEDKSTDASPTDQDVVNVLIPTDDVVLEVEYTGSSKTSLSDADIGAVFDFVDVDGDHRLNLDDTTGGMCKVIDFDNQRKVAYVSITSRLLV